MSTQTCGGLVLLVGRHGTGKSESVRRALGISSHADSTQEHDAGHVLYVEDRAIILHFDPSNAEVHGKVGHWFDDEEVYDYLARVMPAIPAVSMRHYTKGSQLRRAGLSDWRVSLLQMVVPDPDNACMIAVQTDPLLQTEEQRVERYMAMRQCHRATYFRRKAKLAAHTHGPPGDHLQG